MEQAIITLTLIGTEGQLDCAEEEFKVLNLEDQANRLKDKVLTLKNKYPKFGWSLIVADKLKRTLSKP